MKKQLSQYDRTLWRLYAGRCRTRIDTALAEPVATPRDPTIMDHFAADLERPENRYLRTPLVALITAGRLPKAALKDYAVLRWSFQAHANPAMMLSHASFLRGDAVDLHQVVAASEEASISLELLVEIRNKLADAYRTVMSIQ